MASPVVVGGGGLPPFDPFAALLDNKLQFDQFSGVPEIYGAERTLW
jgi:hypothetical protein